MERNRIFKELDLERCESVLYRQGAIIRVAHREAALDCKASIEALLERLDTNGETKDVIVGFLILEQFLMELGGDTSKTDVTDREAVMDSFYSRRSCHPSYEGKTITKAAARRKASFGGEVA